MQPARDYARRQVADRLYEVLMRRPGPTRTTVLLRSLPPEISVGLAGELVATDERFVRDEATVDLAIRAGLRGVNLKTAVQRVAADYGNPPAIGDLASLLASAGDRPASYYSELLETLVTQRDALCAAEGKVVPVEWLLFPEGDTDEDVLWYCELDDDAELAALRSVCQDEGLRGDTPVQTAANVVAAAGVAVSNRVLGFFVHRLHRAEFDPVALLAGLMQEERVYRGPLLTWSPGEVRQGVAAELAALKAAYADEVATTGVDLGPILAEPLPPDHPGFYIEDEALDEVYDILKSSPHPVTVSELLADVLHLIPEDTRFVPAAHSVWGLLLNDPGVIAQDYDTVIGPGAAPEWVRRVPVELQPVYSDRPGDVLLKDEGLGVGLADRVRDPYLEDVGEITRRVTEDMITVDETFYTLPVHHFVAGTMKLRRMDAQLFRMREPIIPFVVVDPEGDRHQAWANTELGLLLGLREVYESLGLQPGSLLQISAGEVPGEWVFEPVGEDEETALSAERREQLAEMAEVLFSSEAGLYEMIRAIMSDHPEGMSFEKLCAEVNTVRRTTRLQVASILSYYSCFGPADGDGDVWLFDAAAVAEGPIAEKRRFVIIK